MSFPLRSYEFSAQIDSFEKRLHSVNVDEIVDYSIDFCSRYQVLETALLH